MCGVIQIKESPSEMHFPRPSATGQSVPNITFLGPNARRIAFVAPASVTAPVSKYRLGRSASVSIALITVCMLKPRAEWQRIRFMPGKFTQSRLIFARFPGSEHARGLTICRETVRPKASAAAQCVSVRYWSISLSCVFWSPQNHRFSREEPSFSIEESSFVLLKNPLPSLSRRSGSI